MTERTEMQRKLREEVAGMGVEEGNSLKLAIATFAYAILTSREARVRGITMGAYRRMAKELKDADCSTEPRELEGADPEEGLELMLRLQMCAEQGKGYIAPTCRGDSEIRYIIGETIGNDGTNN